MPKLNEVQNNALEVVDYLYFYDIVAVETFNEEKKATYSRLLNAIDYILSDRNLSSIQYEIYKHYLLCGVEVYITQHSNIKIGKVDKVLTQQQKDEAYKEISQQRMDIIFEALIQELNDRGLGTEHYWQDILKIFYSSKISNASISFGFRLVSQVLWSEFEGSIAANVYRKFVGLNILQKNIYSSSKYNVNEVENEIIFLRAMLFIEFEILRKKLHIKNDIKNLELSMTSETISDSLRQKKKKYFEKNSNFFTSSDFLKIDNYDLKDKSKVEAYLLSMNPSFCHNRIFTNSHGVWVSLLGAWYLNYEYLTTKKPIYNEANNKGTCSDIARIIMKKDYGFNISGKSLYLKYYKIQKFYEFIHLSINKKLDQIECGFMSPDLSSFFYYNNVMSEGFNNLLSDLVGEK